MREANLTISLQQNDPAKRIAKTGDKCSLWRTGLVLVVTLGSTQQGPAGKQAAYCEMGTAARVPSGVLLHRDPVAGRQPYSAFADVQHPVQ